MSKITNKFLAMMPADTLKGNNTGSPANPSDLTVTQVTAMLNSLVGDTGAGGTKGLVPAPAAGDAAAGKFLFADGTWKKAAIAVAPTTLRTLYVAIAGNDTTGDGSPTNPFASISHALSVITGPNDQDHAWIIRLSAGRFLEAADLVFPPYVNLIGDSHRTSYVRVTGGTNSIKPSSGWATNSSWTTFAHIYFGGTTQLNFDLQTIGGQNSNVVIQDCWIGGAVTWKGRTAGGGDYIEAYDTFIFGAVSLDQTLTQWQGGVFANTLSITNTLAAVSGTYINCNFNGNVSIAGTSFASTQQFAASPFASPGITLTTTGTVTLYFDSISLPPEAQLSLSVGTTMIDLAPISNRLMAPMAAHSFKGNNAGASGQPLDLTATQLTAELNNMVGDTGAGGLKGLAPAPAAGDAAAGKFLKADGTWAAPSGAGITSISIASSNGLAGSSSGGTTPTLTLSTSITGLLKGNGTAISAASAGTDYSAGTSALATGILKSTTSTGALSIAVAADFPTLNQSTTGNAATATAPAAGSAHGVVSLDSSGHFQSVAPSTSGNILQSNGTDWTSVANPALTNPMTTAGDMLYGGASGVPTRLANGTAGQYLISAGTTLAPYWASFAPPVVTRLVSTTYYTFTVTAHAAFVADTYTNNGQTFTVVASNNGTTLLMTGTGAPAASGTLTWASGAGSGNITFASVSSAVGSGTIPLNSSMYLVVEMIGSGGGASGGGAGAGAGTAGNASTFSLGTGSAGGGGAGSWAGGAATSAVNSLAQSATIRVIDDLSGGPGDVASESTVAFSHNPGGDGGNGVYGGGGAGLYDAIAGTAGVPHTGGGGGGGGGSASNVPGNGGSAGSFLKYQVNSPAATATFSVGASPSGGTAGTGGGTGGAGGSGKIIIHQMYQ